MFSKRKQATSDLNCLISEMILDLGHSVTDDERSQGWDEALKARWKDWFVNLDRSIRAGKEIPAGWGIARAMDFDGVGDTPISARAATIGRLLDEGVRY